MSRVCKVILLVGFLVGLAGGCGDKNPKISGNSAPTLKTMDPSHGKTKPKGE